MARYRHRAGIPRRDTLDGIDVHYPRFLSIPRFLKPLDGLFLALRVGWLARRLRRTFAFDRIDAHLAFPDGWAAVRLGRRFRVPVSVTLRGHDVNDLPRYPVRGRQVTSTLRDADAVLAVADALREGALDLGASRERTFTVPNGVDRERFRPIPRDEARAELGLPPSGRLILSVGHLVERKGFHHLVRALPRVLETHEDAHVAIVGGPGEEGDFTDGIERAIAEAGVADRVTLAGAAGPDRLALWYSAADVFCLASAREGRPNVVIEALACGTPVVATRVWGTPELVASEHVGALVDSVDPETLGDALADALSRDWDRTMVAAAVATLDWGATAARIEEILAGLGRDR
jgi:glycosyltransferase involved in cell wall biosynthesis